jgi:hypothetical protein
VGDWLNDAEGSGGFWAIEGGAAHSARLARAQVWVSMGGVQGVLGSADCEVKALATPGTKVRIMPGLCGILSRAVGHGREMYLAENVAEDLLDVPASAGVGRSHLVVVRAENPFLDGEGWPQPAFEDLDEGPYGGGRIIPDVPSNTTSVAQVDPEMSAIALARIDVPASTSTIQTVMIHDLRVVVNPVTSTDAPPVVQPGTETMLSTDTDPIPFPFTAPWAITIPLNATHVDIKVEMTALKLVTGDITGSIHAVIDGFGALTDQPIAFDWPNADVRVALTLIYPNVPVAPALRGTTKNSVVNAKVNPGAVGNLIADSATKVICTAQFKQRPETTT